MNLKAIGKLFTLGKAIKDTVDDSEENQEVESNEPKSKESEKVKLVPQSTVNAETENIRTISERPIEEPRESEEDEPKKTQELVTPDSTRNLVSYKNAADVNLHTKDPRAVEEFIRHNKEVEKILRGDVEADDKLGRDRLGQDILESERLENRRKEEDRKREAERRKAEADKANELAAQKSKGSTEEDDPEASKKEVTESPFGEGMQSLVTFPILSGLGKLGRGIGRGINWLNQNGLEGIKKAGIKGLKKLGRATWNGVKWVAKKNWDGIKWVGKKGYGAARKVTNKIGSVIKNQLSQSKIFNKIKDGLGGIKDKISGGFKKIGSKVKKALSPAVNAIKKPLSKVAEIAKNKIINPAANLATKVKGKVLNSRAAKAVKFLANPKALGKLGKKMLSKILPAVPKIAAKVGMTLAKTGGKAALKQVPVLGIAMGVGEAISDITKGDYVGAGLAALSGIAPTLNLIAPGVGTAISMGAIGADVARDVLKEPVREAIKVFDESDPASILAEGDIDLSNSVNLPEESEEVQVSPDGNPVESQMADRVQPEVAENDRIGNFNWNENQSESTRPQIAQNQPKARSPRLTRDPGSDMQYIFPIKQGQEYGSGSGMKVGKEFKDRMYTAMDFFTDPNGLNLTTDQAAGIVGVLSAESKLIPHIVNKAERDGTARDRGIKFLPKGYGAGIAQWTNPNSKDTRKDQILNYINKHFGRHYNRIEDANLHEQLSAVKHDLEVNRPKTLEMLRNAKNSNEATDIILRGYENGGNGILAPKSFIDKYTWAGGYTGSMFDPHNGRANFAKVAINEFKSRNSNDVVTRANPVFDDLAVIPNLERREMPEVKSNVDISKEGIKTPNLSVSRNENLAVSTQGQQETKQTQGNVSINEGDNINAPTINEGSHKTVNITNIMTTDLLNTELFG